MPHRALVIALLGALVVAASACSPADTVSSTTTGALDTTTSSIAATTSLATTTSTAVPTTTTTTEQGDTVTVLLYPFAEMGPEWADQVFPYGDTEDTLGTAPGGDGGLMLGPEYGAQVPDGTWWFMDAAKLRLAHFSGDGAFIEAVDIPEDVLVGGQYFQYQNPIALDDGSVVASGFRGEASSSLMTLRAGEISAKTIDATVPWVTTDGDLLYGFSISDDQPQSLDPASDQPDPVEWFLTRDGDRFMISIDGSDVAIELPDAGVTKTLQLRFSEDPATEARAGIEVETGSDGTIFILFYGAPVSDETFGIGSFVEISPDGRVGEPEPITEPFTPADPGSPSHLGVTPGTSTPWIMVIGEDGVHVHTRTG
jgi:hypothetical protein